MGRNTYKELSEGERERCSLSPSLSTKAADEREIMWYYKSNTKVKPTIKLRRDKGAERMSEIVSKRKAIFLDNAEEQYKELGYMHRNIIGYKCKNCNQVYFVDESILARYCYHCGAEQIQE